MSPSCNKPRGPSVKNRPNVSGCTSVRTSAVQRPAGATPAPGCLRAAELEPAHFRIPSRFCPLGPGRTRPPKSLTPKNRVVERGGSKRGSLARLPTGKKGRRECYTRARNPTDARSLRSLALITHARSFRSLGINGARVTRSHSSPRPLLRAQLKRARTHLLSRSISYLRAFARSLRSLNGRAYARLLQLKQLALLRGNG